MRKRISTFGILLYLVLVSGCDTPEYRENLKASQDALARPADCGSLPSDSKEIVKAWTQRHGWPVDAKVAGKDGALLDAVTFAEPIKFKGRLPTDDGWLILVTHVLPRTGSTPGIGHGLDREDWSLVLRGDRIITEQCDYSNIGGLELMFPAMWGYFSEDGLHWTGILPIKRAYGFLYR